MVPKRVFMCITIHSEWHHSVTFLEKRHVDIFVMYGHVDDFCQESAGDDGCMTPTLNGKILSHLHSRSNCRAESPQLLQRFNT